MPFSPEVMLLLTILVPAGAVLGILATDRSPNVREGVTIVASLILIALVTSLYNLVSSGSRRTARTGALSRALLKFFD
jgi:multicomponent Na+:H+ antiporter subunit D